MLSLEEAARVAGHARWLETRLFEVLGGWVATEPDPASKALFSAHSLRHAWHADVWRDRLPRVAHLDPDALTVPAAPEVVDLLDALAASAAAAEDGTAYRLAGLGGLVLPTLVADYQERLARAHPLADGPTARWLGFVLADEVAGLREVAALHGGEAAGTAPGDRLRARLGGVGLIGLPRPPVHETM
jgi:hypothetical protein